MLRRDYARDHGARVGDTIAAGDRRLRVVGIGATAGSSDGGWADPADVLGLASSARPVAFGLALRLSEPDSAAAFAGRVTRADEVRAFDWRTQRTNLTEDARRLMTILQTTTLLALLAAAFTLATAISGRVLAQRRQIGLLRAIGLTPAGVTGVLVAHYLVLAVLAAPLGLLAGTLVGDKLSGDFAETLGAPSAGAPGPGLLAVALLIALLVVAAATALPAWRAGRMPVQAALALGRGASSARASRIARIARRLRLPVVVGVGAKDAFSQRGRTALTVASLGLAAALLATAMSFEATMDRLGNDPSLRAQPYDLRLESELPAAEVDRLLARRGEVTAVARVREMLMIGRGEAEIHTRVLDGPLAAFPYAIRDGRGARAPGEVTLGRGALDALDARIGDTVALRLDGKPVELRVVGRHVEPDDEGRGAVTALSSLPAGAAALDEPYWAIRLSPGADAVQTEAALRREGDGRIQVERPIESLQREAADMRGVVYGTVALLLVDRGAQPAHDARPRHPRTRTRLRRARLGRRDAAPGPHDGDRGRRRAGAAGGAARAPARRPWIFTLVIAATDPSDGPDVLDAPGVVVVSGRDRRRGGARRRDQRARLARGDEHPPGAGVAR